MKKFLVLVLIIAVGGVVVLALLRPQGGVQEPTATHTPGHQATDKVATAPNTTVEPEAPSKLEVLSGLEQELVVRSASFLSNYLRLEPNDTTSSLRGRTRGFLTPWALAKINPVVIQKSLADRARISRKLRLEGRAIVDQVETDRIGSDKIVIKLPYLILVTNQRGKLISVQSGEALLTWRAQANGRWLISNLQQQRG